MVEKVRKESEPGRELYAEDFFLSALRCLLSAGQTRERERRASDVAACISAILAVDGEAATLEKRRGCDRVNAEAGRAWALAGPDRGGGGGGGNGCTADGLVATPRWLSPFIPEELARYRGGPGDPGLYLVLLGRVYDVSSGRKHYEPGAHYSGFSGIPGSSRLFPL